MGEDPTENIRRHLQTKYYYLSPAIRTELITSILEEMALILEFCDYHRTIHITEKYIEFRGEDNFGDGQSPQMTQEFLTGFLEACLTEEIPEIPEE